jgi:hypothetical protein
MADNAAAAAPPPPPSIVRLVGGGVARPDAEPPLDLQYNQLAGWLEARGKVAPDWHARLSAIQSKMREAARNMPPDVLALGLAAAGGGGGGGDGDSSRGSSTNDDTAPPLDYFAAVAIRDALAARGERTLFGGLAGPAAVWDKIVRAYEGGGAVNGKGGSGPLLLSEAALALVQAADYDLPALKRQAARLAQTAADAERRGEDQRRAAAAAAAAFARECAGEGVDAARIASGGAAAARRELRRLAARLPAALDTQLVALVTEEDGDLWRAAEYYASVVARHGAAEAAEEGEAAGAATTTTTPTQAAQLLPTLAEVREGRVSEVDLVADVDEDDDSDDEGGRQAEAAPIEVAWGDDKAGGDAAAGGISWDIELSAADGGGGGDDGGGGGEQEVAVAEAREWGIDVAGAGEEEGEAKEEKEEHEAARRADAANNNDNTDAPSSSAAARRLVRDADFRARLADDLHELRAFVATRLAEMRGGGGGGGGGGSGSALLLEREGGGEGAGAGGRVVDESRCANMLAAADAALAALSDSSARRLLRLAASRAYRGRQAAALARKAQHEARLLAAAVEADARRREAQLALADANPRVARAAARLRALKKRLEAEFEARVLGGARRANIQGDINRVLAGV